MPKFKSRPVEIEAVQLRFDTWDDVLELARRCYVGYRLEGFNGTVANRRFPNAHVGDDELCALIPTLEGDMLARQGDWIILGTRNELYPCKPDVFAVKYEPVITGPYVWQVRVIIGDGFNTSRAPRVIFKQFRFKWVAEFYAWYNRRTNFFETSFATVSKAWKVKP